MARTTIDELLDAARRRLRRLEPQQARDATAAGAILIDIRADHQRERDGVIPDAHFVPRNVLDGASTRHPGTAIHRSATASTVS